MFEMQFQVVNPTFGKGTSFLRGPLDLLLYVKEAPAD